VPPLSFSSVGKLNGKEAISPGKDSILLRRNWCEAKDAGEGPASDTFSLSTLPGARSSEILVFFQAPTGGVLMKRTRPLTKKTRKLFWLSTSKKNDFVISPERRG